MVDNTIIFVSGVFSASWQLFLEMAPYLLLGFVAAGILREFITSDAVARHLGEDKFASVIKAALFGIPLPLCSCGVVPPTLALRRSGASRGAVVSFLIATPTSGVDSILATYALLGPVFALYRVLASFVASLISGFAAILIPDRRSVADRAVVVNDSRRVRIQPCDRLRRIIAYSFSELLGDLGGWLILGLIIGGAITWALPEQFISHFMGSSWQAILVMLLVSIPWYVCATGSIPIAAALMLKGLSPGAAFVFLLVGPATNAVSLTLISQELGKRTTAIYLFSLSASAIVLGLLLDAFWQPGEILMPIQQQNLTGLWSTVEFVSAIVLTIALFIEYGRYLHRRLL